MDAAFSSYLVEDYVEFGHYAGMSMTAWELSLLDCETDEIVGEHLTWVENIFNYIIPSSATKPGSI